MNNDKQEKREVFEACDYYILTLKNSEHQCRKKGSGERLKNILPNVLMASQNVPSLSSSARHTNSTILGMSVNHVEKEQQCVLHWFHGWSPYQKQDFLKFLLDRAVPQSMDTLFEAMHSLNVRAGPPSIFQCQLKLMGEWFSEWTDKERNDLMTWLAAKDPAFVEKFNEEAAKATQMQQ